MTASISPLSYMSVYRRNLLAGGFGLAPPGRSSTADAAIAASALLSNTSHTPVRATFRSSWFMKVSNCRFWCPNWNTMPVSLTALYMAFASSSVRDMHFSQ